MKNKQAPMKMKKSSGKSEAGGHHMAFVDSADQAYKGAQGSSDPMRAGHHVLSHEPLHSLHDGGEASHGESGEDELSEQKSAPVGPKQKAKGARGY